MQGKDKVKAHLDKSIINNVLQFARASLKEPSRPFTPSEQPRTLFCNQEVTRPPSSYNLKTFTKDLEPIKPKQLCLEDPIQTSRKVVSDESKAGPRKPVKVLHFEQVDRLVIEKPEDSPSDVIQLLEKLKYDQNFIANLSNSDLDNILENLSEFLAELSYSPEIAPWVSAKQLLKSLARALESFEKDLEKNLKICKCLLENITTHDLLYLKKGNQFKTSPLALGAIKYLYQFSKNAENDLKFLNEGISETLYSVLLDIISEDSFENIDMPYEFLLYLLGILKNLTNTKEVAEKCYGFFNVFTSILPSPYLEDTPNSNSKHIDLLVQVTGIIKNLISNESLEQVLEFAILEKLAVAIHIYKDSEVVLNSYKAISKVSFQEIVSATLRNFSQVFIETIENSADIQTLTRALYIQANILSSFPSNKTANFNNLFTHWIKSFQTKDPQSTDFLIKLIRFSNNLLSSKVYPMTASFAEELLKNLLETVSSYPIQDYEELILNTVSCIANLVYYDFNNTQLISDHYRICTLSKVSSLLVDSFNEEITVEVLRTIANLTRHEQISKEISSLFLVDIFLMMFGHSNWNIVYFTLGSLINVSSNAKEILYSERVFESLIDLLLDVEKVEREFCQQIFMVFCNLCKKTGGLVPWESVAGEENVGKLNEAVKRCLAQKIPVAEELEQFMPKPWVGCPAEGCGRKFPNKQQLDEHIKRRH